MNDTPEPPEEAGEFPPERPAYSGPSISITDEMKSSYLDYAMSVIVSRAIPDLRDGLKPVHRRILYGMHEAGNTHTKPVPQISSRPVFGRHGQVNHPHGDAQLARSNLYSDQTRYLGADGAGISRWSRGFGRCWIRRAIGFHGRPDQPRRRALYRGPDGQVAQYLVADIFDKGKPSISRDNFTTARDREPTVLAPPRFPNMAWSNGAGGIAVRMDHQYPAAQSGRGDRRHTGADPQ